MRTREEIIKSTNSDIIYFDILSVLLDIRELLQKKESSVSQRQTGETKQ